MTEHALCSQDWHRCADDGGPGEYDRYIAGKCGLVRPYYQRGGITLYLGDARELLPRIRGDVVLTDPPYNAGKNYGEGTDDKQPWPVWCCWWDDMLALCKQAAPDVFAFLSQPAWRKYTRHGRYEITWTLVWNKPLSLAVTALPLMPHWEPIAYWGTATRRGGNFWGGDVLSHNVEFGKWRRNHPTPKPISLMLDLVGRFPSEATVVDPFAGSGSTLIAAQRLGRRAIGIEISEQYAEQSARILELGLVEAEAHERGQLAMWRAEP